MRVALPSAHVVRRATCHRRHEHPTERLADLISVGVVQKRDPLPADLIAARYHGLGENVNQARQVGFGWEPVELKPGGAESVPHAFGIDEILGDGMADPQRAPRRGRVPENDDLAMALLSAR